MSKEERTIIERTLHIHKMINLCKECAQTLQHQAVEGGFYPNSDGSPHIDKVRFSPDHGVAVYPDAECDDIACAAPARLRCELQITIFSKKEKRQ